MIGAAAVRKRYWGDKATGYDARRVGRPFWVAENTAVDSMLSDLPPGSRILDVPVGTARYAPIYHKNGFRAVGVDISSDMLTQAQNKVRGTDFALCKGDIFHLRELSLGAFDAVVCTRLLNWLLPTEMAAATAEIMHMGDRVVLSIELGKRVSDRGNNPHEPDLFAAVIRNAGGVIKREIVVTEPNYMVVQIERAE